MASVAQTSECPGATSGFPSGQEVTLHQAGMILRLSPAILDSSWHQKCLWNTLDYGFQRHCYAV